MVKSIDRNIRILVIGDIMIDHYIHGNCNRISPEAPVPVVEVIDDTYTLGGAGNVLKNIIAFGASVDIITMIGNDSNGSIVINELSLVNISTSGILKDPNRCTTIKSRVLSINHQLIRLDRESVKSINFEQEEILLKILERDIDNYSIVLLSDYNKGLLTSSLLKGIFSICRTANVRTVLDPKGLDFAKYKGLDIIKPNKKEAAIASGIVIDSEETLELACIKIREITNCNDVIITMSEEGIACFSQNKLTIIPTKAIDVIDVTGAGDTVLAALGLSLAFGNNIEQACEFANHAAAIVVSKVGSATASLEEIAEKFGDI